ncbi:uncharacterized protein LOC131145621 isoform X1 [Malania oleifera]|uniref:uncharacterized protein LOC131145621 isoform X1 n=1 Tax=Malania oleifera TaxID=397392 RepID=UPI0025AEA64F|nr:uncharacterized protein LOC131145621 isoform X1 [Malania oleifera]
MEADDLFENAMRRQLDKIAEACKADPALLRMKITKSEDTALHIAVTDPQSDAVGKLIGTCLPEGDEFKEAAFGILNAKNERGDTPLHMAAVVGKADICRRIADRDRRLLFSRNLESETPLFLAAFHGKKEAFLCLHVLQNQTDDWCSRRSNGDTILHVAISGEHYDLAYGIIQLYPHLTKSINENGLSPLHITASKPNAFRSTSHLGLFERIIYHCAFVDELKKETIWQECFSDISEDKNKFNYPRNYETCMDLFQAMKNIITVLVTPHKHRSSLPSSPLNRVGSSDSMKIGNPIDEEDPQRKSRASLGGSQPKKKHNEGHHFPSNYDLFFLFFKLMMKAFLIVLGFGFATVTTSGRCHALWTQLKTFFVI